MSFLHNVRVGFFGTPEETCPQRDLQLEECIEYLKRFVAGAPDELQIELEPSPKSNPARGVVLASADGFPIVLKGGLLICPYLASRYILGSIAFVVYFCHITGCSIYSDDEGRFLSQDEFIPKTDFARILQEVIYNRPSPAG
jgi:hypothetical protein